MDKKKILILAYSPLISDPRIQRQINALKADFIIETSGFSNCGDETIPFYQIYTPPPFSLKRKIKRLLQYITRQFDDYYWDMGKTSLMQVLRKNSYATIIANDIHTLPLALAIADNNGSVYFDAHEYHPQEFEDNIKWKLYHKPYIEYLCKKYIPKANAFSTVCEGIAKKYNEYIGILPVVITNATYYYNLKPSEVVTDKITLIHHGASIPSRKIEQMIDVMQFLGEKYSLFLMLTNTESEYYTKITSYASKYKNVFFVKPVPYNEIVTIINQYDIGLYCLPLNSFNNHFALPNKFFEFVQARLAIVISANPEMANLLNKHNLGLAIANYTPESIATAIKKLSVEQINQFKHNSNSAASILSAEDNMKKINLIVSNLVNKK